MLSIENLFLVNEVGFSVLFQSKSLVYIENFCNLVSANCSKLKKINREISKITDIKYLGK